MRTVISASRRTDLPCFYYDWLQAVLKAGEAELPNPRFPAKKYRVDLKPDSVHTLVLWSKDFRNVLTHPGYLENYNLYFQYTINNYSKLLEPNVPLYRDSLQTLAGLLRTFSPEQFNIRFDPVLLSTRGEADPTPLKPGQARLNAFTLLCKDLAALGMEKCRVTTSYVFLYEHVRRRLIKAGVNMIHLDEAKLILFFERLAEIASRYGLSLYSCASPLVEQVKGIRRGSCIDGHLLENLFGGRVSKAKDHGQRRACGCSKSSDIGSYDKICRFQCVYCYQQFTYLAN
ncbi:MAG TPA: DUF1848 family protein [Methylomusa anaerophila]|uniref:DUF1848 domain-containing protein n=2 Tax=Methylomusa anaerophila TaxID=1930071 RepID=A0A348AFM6_9FIRM|nr:DUF1848 family protein [Methylomusa anaerophila]BBB89874.1 hypothetical protein MAMMFC1_00514 [Methylomusa anaerophila]HML89079.1 DUF1848 family protein [Methylomusa anaerophila]